MTPTRLAAPLAAVLALIAVPDGRAQDGQGCGPTYTVRSGDTVGAIAARCDTSVEALLAANPRITDPARIRAGWELTVPRSGTAPAVAEDWRRERDARAAPLLASGTYKVEAGDSMASIATKLGVPLRDLLAANDGVDPYRLKPGQELSLPVGAAGDEADSAAGEDAETEAAQAGEARTEKYTVRQGDSLSGIASRLGVPLRELRAANEGVDPRRLKPGQELVVPAVSGGDAAPAEKPKAQADPEGAEASAAAAEDAEAATARAEDTEAGETPPEDAQPATATYTVKPGDSLSGIASGLGVPLRALLAANAGIDPRRLKPGQELVVPAVAGGDAAPADRPEAQAEAEEAGAEQAGSEAGAAAAEDAEAATAAATARAEDTEAGETPPEDAQPAPATYTVKPGDSLSGIASGLGVPLRALLAANEGIDPRRLKPGQVLTVPAAAESEAPSADTAKAQPDEAGAEKDKAEEAEAGASGTDDAEAANAQADDPQADDAQVDNAPAAEAPPGDAQPATASYTVKPGDSMSGIAVNLGVPLRALMAANAGVNPRRLKPGQKLAVPAAAESDAAPAVAAGAASEPEEASAEKAEVEAADAEAAQPEAPVAEAPVAESPATEEAEADDTEAGSVRSGAPHGADLSPEQAAQGDAPPSAASLGDAAPGDAEPGDGQAGDALAREAPPADARAEGAQPATARYTVRQGDSMSSIASRLGVPLRALLAANEGVDPRRLKPGQELAVPPVAESGTPSGRPVEAEAAAGAASADIALPGNAPRPGAQPGEAKSGDARAGDPQPGDGRVGSRLGSTTRRDAVSVFRATPAPPPRKPSVAVAPAATGDIATTGPAVTGPAAADPADTRPASAGAAAASAPSVPAPGTGSPATDRLFLEGRIARGTECPVLHTGNGEVYSLVSQLYGFTPGAWVTIEAEPVEMSFCLQGQTVRVTSMTEKP